MVANPDDHDPFAGATVGDRRIRFSPSLEDATSSATSEYVCYLNGHGAPSDVLFSEMIKRLDQRPEYVTATTGLRLAEQSGWGGEDPERGRRRRLGLAIGHAALLVHPKTRGHQTDARGSKCRRRLAYHP